MEVEVVLGPRAVDDLSLLFDYIAERAGVAVATAYLARIESACFALRLSPRRGTPRDDLYAGLRTVAFERRATIGFVVGQDRVVIRRILHGGRNLTAAVEWD